MPNQRLPDTQRRIFETCVEVSQYADLWQRFTEKAQRAGSTPARVLRQLIERYVRRGKRS